MNRTITFDLTKDLILESLRGSQGRWHFLWGLLRYGFGALALCKLALVLVPDIAEFVFYLAIAGAVLYTLYYWLIYAKNQRSSLAVLDNLPQRTVIFTIANDGYTVEGAMGSSSVNWDKLERINSFDKVWLLHSRGIDSLLPADEVDQELELFLVAKARQYGATVTRDHRIIDPSEHGVPRKRPWRPSWVTLVVVALAVYLAATALYPSAAPRTKTERFVVEALNAKVVFVEIKEGETLELSVVVTAGSPVNVVIGRDARKEDNNFIIKGAGLAPGNKTANFRCKEKWAYPGPAVIIVGTPDQSAVVLQADVSRSQ